MPRGDGRVLAGATEEDAGYVKETTAAALDKLTRFAHRLVPALRNAPVETTLGRPASRHPRRTSLPGPRAGGG